MLRAPLPAKPLQEEGYVPRRWEKEAPWASRPHNRHLLQEASKLTPRLPTIEDQGHAESEPGPGKEKWYQEGTDVGKSQGKGQCPQNDPNPARVLATQCLHPLEQPQLQSAAKVQLGCSPLISDPTRPVDQSQT